MPLTQVSSRAIEDTLRYVLGASGTNHYTFTGKGLNGAVNDPTLTLSRGHTYIFENRNSSGAHPFYIKTSIGNGGTNDAYNTGVTNNGGAGGTEIVFTVPHDAPDVLYYQCSSHINMAGQLIIAKGIPDESITASKLASSSVTAVKIASGNVDNTAIGNNQISLNKFQQGTPANDGKFLRANNGADPSFETIDLTALSASNLTSGTIPDARFPATLPAISGANLTGIQGIPSGVIMLWSGAANAIPSGFVLCDGNNSTPDLRDRFVVGAGNSYSVGDTGGESSVTLSTSQIPSHNHSAPSLSILVSNNAGGSSDYRNIGRARSSGSQQSANSGSISMGSSTGSTGSGGSHENRPPYYALCYIMKT